MISPLVRWTGRLILRPLLAMRTRRLAALVASQLRDGEEVLDVGCGSLAVGRAVCESVKVHWTGIDTVDYNETNLTFRRYDGRQIPFANDQFDVVLLSFVLHHCADSLAILDEVCRVTRSRVIVGEDVIRNRSWSLFLAKVHDFLANKLVEPDVELPYAFHTQTEWSQIFHARNLEVIASVTVKTHPLAFVDQRLFILRKR